MGWSGYRERELGDYHLLGMSWVLGVYETEEFWNELSKCVGSFGRNESVGVLGDLNARVGNEMIGGTVGQNGM